MKAGEQSTTAYAGATKGIILFLGLFLFLYTAFRAYVLPITWDEAYTYLQFTRNGIVFPDKYEMMGANNHLLNSWLNIYLVKWFGVSEFVLRIPSLIARLLFLFFSYQLVKDFQNRWLIITSFLIINLNPYAIDFFSLSRGYALSLGLMLASIYYLYLFINKQYKTKYVVIAICLGGLATAANFVLLNYFVISFGLMLLLVFYNLKVEKNKMKFLLSLALSATIFSSFLFFLLPIILKLKDVGALFYGGSISFWTDTFCTIIDRSFYELGYNYWFQRIAKGFVLVVTMATSVYVGIKFVKKQANKTNLFLTILLLLLGLSVLSTIVQHYVFGTLFLMDRTALFLVVLFNLVLVFFINELSKKNKRASFVSYVAGIVAVFHFALSFNLHYVLEWKSNADVKQMLSDLDKIKIIPPEKKNISICIPLSFDQSINYYRAINNLTWINPVERSNSVNFFYDYLYLEPLQLQKINMDSLEIIKTYPLTTSILAKPKYPPNLTKICLDQQLNFENTTEGKYIIHEETEYSQGFNYKIGDSITPNKKAEVVFIASVLAPDISQCNLNIVISFGNKNGVLAWKRAFIKDWIHQPNEWVDACYTCIVPEEIRAGDELSSYIWNPNKHRLFVKRMELKWLSKP